MEGPERIDTILKRALPSETKRIPNSEPVDEEQPGCLICRDFGFVTPLKADGSPDYAAKVIRCRCKVESDAEANRKSSLKFCGLPFGTEDWTFDNFKVDPQYPSLKEAKRAAQSFAEGGPDNRWLILKGKVDRGKTHLAIAICREYLARGIPAIYTLVPDAMDNLRAGFDKSGEEGYRPRLERLKKVDLLVLDDLGAGKSTEWTNEKLMLIIDHRYVEGLPLVVTTNKNLKELPFDDEHRIGSRLLRHPAAEHIIIEANEHRLRKK